MKLDGNVYLWIPSSLTLSYLDATTAAIINGVHTAIATGRTDYAVGELNPYYFQLNDLDMGGAPFTRDAEPGMAVCGPINNLSYLGMDYISLIVAFGGNVEALPVFFELTDLNVEVPETFPERTYTDSNNVEHVHTWVNWGVSGPSHYPVQYNGKWYKSSCYGASGVKLNADQWIGFYRGGGVVKSQSEYQAIQAAQVV